MMESGETISHNPPRFYRQPAAVGKPDELPDARTFAAPITPPASRATLHGTLSHKDLVSLYHSIEAALPDLSSRIVLLSSCNSGEGVTTIATGLASLATNVLEHRTLLVSMNSEAHHKPAASLADVAGGKAAIGNAIVAPGASGMPFDSACLTFSDTVGDLLAYQSELKQLLSTLRSQYRFILFHFSGILNDPAGVALSRLTDGVVLVIEAERTRAPAAKQAIRYIMEKGGNIIGITFNKRRFYIPRWLYRWL